MARFGRPRSTLNALGLSPEVVRGQANFYTAYARQLERGRRSPDGRDVWHDLANPAEKWQGLATLAATYRYAAQYTALLDSRRAGLLAFRSAMAYLEGGMPFGALLALGLIPNRMLDLSMVRSRIVGPARSMMAEPAEHNPVQQMYLYFIATRLPGPTPIGPIDNLRQSLAAHQLHPVGAQGLPLMNYLELANSISREDTSGRLVEMSDVAPRRPQDRTIESLASMGGQHAASLRSAQHSGLPLEQRRRTGGRSRPRACGDQLRRYAQPGVVTGGVLRGDQRTALERRSAQRTLDLGRVHPLSGAPERTGVTAGHPDPRRVDMTAEGTAADPTWYRVLEIVPALAWPLLVLLALLLFRTKITERLPRLTSVKTPLFEATFADQLADAQQSQEPVSPGEEKGAIGRALQARSVCSGKRVLWVDDNPGNNHQLAKLFQQLLEIRVEFQLSTEDAMRSLLTDSDFTMVITDMARGLELRAGEELVRQMHAANVYRPTVIYSSRTSAAVGVPAGAFGLTNRADHLLHYIIDICERASFGG